MQLLC
ncbi:hypothetical protein VCNHCC010F_003376A, partial [Vibrio cholerae O1 str. NHCC-010F]